MPTRCNPLNYKRNQGIDAYLKRVSEATSDQLIEIERQGVEAAFIADLIKRMEIPSSRLFTILRIPSATAARKIKSGAFIDGRAGLAAAGLIKLLVIADSIAQDSATEPEKFDSVKWLGQWIERPLGALGGRKPSEYLDTPTGVEIVARALGAMRSGAYL